MVKLIAITGGKGGTGKSTIATALSLKLAEKNKVLLVDLDVDCPNDHIILGIEQKQIAEVDQVIPKIIDEKCIKCGKCAEACYNKAIVFVPGNYPFLIGQQCNGCNSCILTCNNIANAIVPEKKKVGMIMKGTKENLALLTGMMDVGNEEPTPIVRKTKEIALSMKQDFDFIVFDSAAGTHCNVIAAIQGTDFIIAVTEPTPLAQHDLDLIMQLSNELNLKSYILINKATIADNKPIHKTAEKYSAEIIAAVPYDKEIAEQYANSKQITHKTIADLAEKIKK